MRRRGVAVPVALLLLLALTGLAHGALLLARREEAASRLAATLLARELAVRAGLRAALRSGDTLPLLPRGGEAALPTSPVPGAPALRLRVRRLSAELFLLRADAGGAEASAAGLVAWALDPAARAFAGASGAPGAAPLAGLQGPGPSDLAACDEASAEVLQGVPLAHEAPPGLGLLRGDSLLARAALRVSGVVAPDPGAPAVPCPTDDAGNWGAPGRPHHSCRRHRPFVAADGDLLVEGGEGQGVLAVAGDLTLRGTRYEGLVLAGGRLRLLEGAHVRGAVRTGGGLAVGPASRLDHDPCSVYLGLRDARALRAPFALPAGGWIRPL